MKILGMIPARGGSKGVPRKNIKPIAGKSLVERAFVTAKESKVPDRIILSTDSKEIADLGRRIGCEVPFLRPPELALDNTPIIDVVVHLLGELGKNGEHYDALLLLQPTAPQRSIAHIEQSVSLLGDNDSVCSVIPLDADLSLNTIMKIDADGFLDFMFPGAAKIFRRQDAPVAYKRDGTIYLTKTKVLVEKKSFFGQSCIPMVLAPSETLNIDTPEDWKKAETILQERNL